MSPEARFPPYIVDSTDIVKVSGGLAMPKGNDSYFLYLMPIENNFFHRLDS